MIPVIIGILFLNDTPYTAIGVSFIIWGVIRIIKGCCELSKVLNQ